MSLLGILGQLDLSLVLQRIEKYAKTGLLQIRQEMQWVELYFQDGQLVCIGPVRMSVTLGERLRHDGVISTQALQEALLVLGPTQFSETRMALVLMDLGYVRREELRAWFARKATEVLQALLTWSSGEIYFEEDVVVSDDRLRANISVTSLLSIVAANAPASRSTQPLSHIRSTDAVQPPVTDMSLFPTIVENAQLQPGSPSTETALPVIESSPIFTGSRNETSASVPPPLQRSQPAQIPSTPKRIDISFMRPDMILMAADLSAFRESNPPKQLTPDQWRLLTRVDGRSSLQTACQELAMTPELVCKVAGELIAEGLLHLSMPGSVQTNEFSPVSRDVLNSGLNNGYVAPGYAPTTAPPWSAALPPGEGLPPSFSTSIPCETQSQWGNGGNGATFVPGRGWIANPQPLQPLPSSESLAPSSGIYDLYAIRGGS